MTILKNVHCLLHYSNTIKNNQKKNILLSKNFRCKNFFITENIVKYESPRGEIREPDVDLEDISYDGILDGNMMRGGLGQLVDGLFGADDYQKLLQGEHSGNKVFRM